MNLPVKYDKVFNEAAVRYSQITSIRAAVQIIPWIGGALDTLLGGQGSKILQARLDNFLKALNDRLSRIESIQPIEANESFFDLMIATFDGVLRARSEEKRRRFANLIAHQVQSPDNWEDAEAAVRLLSDLTEQHIVVLMETMNAPICQDPFTGLRVVTLEDEPHGPKHGPYPKKLHDFFPKMPDRTLHLICSELVARGLLRDEGFGRFETKAMEYFITTDLAEWLLAWIKE